MKLPDPAAVLGATVERFPPVAPPVSFTPISLGNFLAKPIPTRKMLLGPIIAESSLNMLYGPRGIGKTHLVNGIAAAIAGGSSFLKWNAPAPRKVLVIDGEMPASALQERWKAIAASAPNMSFVRENVAFLASDLFPDGLPDLSREGGQAAIAPALDGFDLLVIDNLSTLARTGRENEAESWGAVQGWALAQRRVGRAVLFVHHAGKGGDQRGTSRREDVLETVIRLDRPSDYEASEGARFVINFTKARGFMGDDAEAFEAAMTDGVWTHRSVKDARSERILALAADGVTHRDIAAEIGCSAATVCRVLKSQGR